MGCCLLLYSVTSEKLSLLGRKMLIRIQTTLFRSKNLQKHTPTLVIINWRLLRGGVYSRSIPRISLFYKGCTVLVLPAITSNPDSVHSFRSLDSAHYISCSERRSTMGSGCSIGSR